MNETQRNRISRLGKLPLTRTIPDAPPNSTATSWVAAAIHAGNLAFFDCGGVRLMLTHQKNQSSTIPVRFSIST